VKPAHEFNRRQSSPDGLQPRCRACCREWYEQHRNSHIDNALRRKRLVREQLRQSIADFLYEHPCVDCGEADIRCLDFDHEDPTTKTKEVSVLAFDAAPLSVLLAEIEKCSVRCANCHRKRTASMRGSWRQRWLDQRQPDR
jgi:hypothetical protein